MAARGGGRWRQRPEFTIPGWNEAQNMRRGARLCKRLASALVNKTCRYDMNMTAARSWVKGFAHIHELALRISKPSAAGGCFLHESARILQSSPVCERCGADYSARRGRCKYAKLLVGGRCCNQRQHAARGGQTRDYLSCCPPSHREAGSRDENDQDDWMRIAFRSRCRRARGSEKVTTSDPHCKKEDAEGG